MKKQSIIKVLLLTAVFSSLPHLYSSEPTANLRTIRLLQDDGQIRIASKLYELKHARASDIRPFIEAAVKRYSSNSKVERVNYAKGKEQMLIVSTGIDFIPYVDELISGLDQSVKPGTNGSIIDGTGITRITYTPNYRAAEDIVRIVNTALRTSEGLAFLNKDTNIIYWKDDYQAALATLAWVKYLDRPLPQANIKLNYYEVRESKLRDIGLDYLAWKNGPGLNLFAAGFNDGKLISDEAVWQFVNGLGKLAELTENFSSSWGYGAFFTAPYFDLSFVRLLQQSGNAKLLATADLTFVNTAVYDAPELNTHLPKVYTTQLSPGYGTVSKDENDKSSIISNPGSILTLTIYNPVICFGAAADEISLKGTIPATKEFYQNSKGGVVFAYNLRSQTVSERSNRGEELGNATTVSGELTLGFKTEKLLASYIREQDVEQTVGIPFLVDIPILKYIFGTTTSIKERTYIIVTAQAELVHPAEYPSVAAAR